MFSCWPEQFRCLDDSCISMAHRCDGIWDCHGGEDEISCDNFCRGGRFTCRNRKTCIEHHQGRPDGFDNDSCHLQLSKLDFYQSFQTSKVCIRQANDVRLPNEIKLTIWTEYQSITESNTPFGKSRAIGINTFQSSTPTRVIGKHSFQFSG